MARTRSIKPGFFMNEELAELPCEARLLFIGLWTIADRAGRLEDRPRKIKAAVFPYEECDVDTLLELLAGKGFLNRYRVEGLAYIEIRNFIKHQKPHPKEAPSEVPAPADEVRGSVNHPGSGRHAGSGDHSGPANGGGAPKHRAPANYDDDHRNGREKAGAGHEKVRTSREKLEPGHEKSVTSRAIPEQDRSQPPSGREQDRPGPEIPALSIEKRIRGQEEEWEGKDAPEPEPSDMPPSAAASAGALIREPAVKAVFEYWRARTGHSDAKLTREREMKIRGRLAEGYTVDQLKAAIEGCRGSPFHQGDNERGHRYDDITLICRSGSKVEQFIEMEKGNGNERNQPARRSNVKKILEGLELVRARAAQSGDPGDDNQQGEGGMLAASVRTG